MLPCRQHVLMEPASLSFAPAGPASLEEFTMEHFEEYVLIWAPAAVVLGLVVEGVVGVHEGQFIDVVFSDGFALLEFI